MRRLRIGLAVLGFIAAALPGAARAAPDVAFEARFVPIAGYRRPAMSLVPAQSSMSHTRLSARSVPRPPKEDRWAESRAR
jgi:hypothetical protein